MSTARSSATRTDAPIRVVLPRLHEPQRRIIRESKRFNVVACGRRFGKSVLGIDRAIHAALEGYPVGYYAPTHKMLTEVWRELVELVGPVVARKSAQEHRVELLTGGVVDMWSLDAGDTSRGRRYRRAIIDEAAMVVGLLDTWNAVIRPTLTDFKGDAWFLSTPKGINGFHVLYQRGVLNKDKWASWHMPTTANPYIDPEEIEEARRETPSDLFRQEYEAEFISGAGAVFRNLDACLVLKQSTPDQHAGHRIVAGVDWAMAQDFTVISVVCAECCEEVALDRFNKIDYGFQRDRLTTIVRQWNVVDVLGEENSIGKPNIDQLYSEGLPIRGFQTTAQSKGPLVRSMALALEREEFKFLDDATARAEMLAYKAKINPDTNRVSFSAPSGQHDDTVIARCLALKAALDPLPGFAWT